jgi:hypothetical protein
VRVSPVRLRRSGRDLRRAGQDLARGARQAWPSPAAAAGHCPGWDAGAAAVEAAREWQELLHDLAGQVAGLGQAFGAAADAYAACDERAASRTGGTVPR